MDKVRVLIQLLTLSEEIAFLSRFPCSTYIIIYFFHSYYHEFFLVILKTVMFVPSGCENLWGASKVLRIFEILKYKKHNNSKDVKGRNYLLLWIFVRTTENQKPETTIELATGKACPAWCSTGKRWTAELQINT